MPSASDAIRQLERARRDAFVAAHADARPRLDPRRRDPLENAKEAFAAFQQKRTPQWEHR